MAAAGVADRPRRAGIAGRRGQRVVAALAVGQPDRVDRRQVDRRRSRARPAAAAGAATPVRPPHERGNSSYQEPNRARSRSTSSGQRLRAGGSRRGGSGRARSRPRAPRRAPCRAWRPPGSSGRSSSAIACSISAVAPASPLCSAAACSSTTPSDSSLERSVWPPATLRASSSRQVRELVGPGLDRVLPAPGRSTVNRPAQRTPPRWASIALQLRLAGGAVGSACGGRPRAAARGRRGTRRRRPRPCRRRSA